MTSDDLSIHFGDLLCIISSIMFAFMIILGDIHAKKEDPVVLGIIQLATVGILSTILAIIFENYEMYLDSRGFFIILFLSLFCTAYCYIMQIYTQKSLSAVESGLILTFEPMFSVFFSFLFLGEILSFKAFIGAVLIIIGIIFGGVL